MKALLLLLALNDNAFAATTPQSSAETPFVQLYNVDLNNLARNHENSEIIRLQFLNAFFSLLPTLREHELSLERWFREDHIIYLLGSLSDGERKQMIPIFEKIGQKIEAGDREMKTILNGLRPAVLVARVSKIDSEVWRLKEMHKDVIRLALTKHEEEKGQKYGDFPYSYHLRKVREVLARFGFGPKDSIFGLKIGTAAWLHDVLEDTDVTFEQLAELFGTEIAETVEGVTKMKIQGLLPEELARLTYWRTRKLQASRILKVADRIANVEEGLLDLFAGKPSKVQKYIDEWPIFHEMLFVAGDADNMWAHLQGLLTNLKYAQNFAMANLYKMKPAECLPELVTSPAR
jgi:hypothetical protein